MKGSRMRLRRERRIFFLEELNYLLMSLVIILQIHTRFGQS